MLVAPPPIVVNITQPHGWVSSVLSLLQFVGTSSLAITTYLVTRKDKRNELQTAATDKTRERKALWFHKVVVDDALITIPDFTSTARTKLQDCSRALYKGKIENSTQAQLDELLGSAISAFSVDLSQFVRSLSGRIRVMDIDLSRRIEAIGERHETTITTWMQRLLTAEPFDGRESLPSLIASLETELLVALYEYEFASIPVTPPIR